MNNRNNRNMKIVKRDGKIENLSFDKIKYRLRKLVNKSPVLKNIDSDLIALETIKILHDNIKTSELDEESARIANIYGSKHPEYSILASRIIISNMHKNTTECFSEMAEMAFQNKNELEDTHSLINEEIINIIRKNKDTLNFHINYNRDYLYNYFGYKTLEEGYLLKVYLGNAQYKIIERPQHLLMRVALGIHKDNINNVLQSYDLMSEHYFTHATPTLYNAGTNRQQMSSCFLLSIEDSMKGIYKCISDCAEISKNAGGIGIAISDIRAKGSYIKGTNGKSDGIVKMLKVFNATAKFANQGSKRNGSFAVYLEPWHADIMDFLELRLANGYEENRVRELFYALWINDIFMEAVEKDTDWYLMSINNCPGLTETYGNEFNKLYAKYVEEKKYTKVIKAREIWNKILVSQIETGMPYMSYKDSVNKKSNQKNIGIIKSSNLCVVPETLILTSKGYYQIQDLEDSEIKVWNGYEFSKVTVRKTGNDAKILKVKLSNGMEIECTHQHKFHDIHGDIIEAQHLKDTTELLNDYNYPIINCNVYLRYDDNEVPINYNLTDKIKWFECVCDKYIGTKYSNIAIEHKTKEYIYNTMYLLNTLGVKCVIKKKSNKNDISFNIEEITKDTVSYDTSYLLFISDEETQKLYDLGFNPKIFNNKMVPGKKHNLAEYLELNIRGKIITVTSVINEGRTSDTYCFTEPKRNLGVFNGILTGNCNEITLHTNKNEIAVCNIATFSLPKYLEKDSKGNNVYNFKKLYDVVKIVTRNMNNIIDNNYYPTPETETSNKNNRPISLGIQGLHNLFFEMRIPYESDIAKQINKDIMETIQYAGWEMSMELAKEKKCTYKTYEGSPISQGLFQHNLWDINESELSGRWDWEALRQKIKEYGVYNSMITALPPTASTSQLLCNYESFEPQNTNIFMRSTKSGEFPIINQYLLNDLIKLNLWNQKMKERIIFYNGSIQNIKEIPDNLKELYKTRWEISQKTLIDYSVNRGYFVDQSQSLNIYMAKPTAEKLTSMHFYGWKSGLKTGMYYLRSKPAVDAQKFSIDKQLQIDESEKLVCSIQNKSDCEMCSG